MILAVSPRGSIESHHGVNIICSYVYIYSLLYIYVSSLYFPYKGVSEINNLEVFISVKDCCVDCV